MAIMSSDNQDKLCNICGHIGYAEVLATCSRCSTACEHIYCMREFNMELPEVWTCEACENADGSPKPDLKEDYLNPASDSKCCDELVRQLPKKQLRPVQTGKVKFLPAEEVIRLSSGAAMSMQPAFRLKPSVSKFVTPSSRRTSSASRAVTPRFSPPKVKSNPSFFPAESVRHVSRRVSSERNQKTSALLKDSKAHAEDHICEELLLEAKLPSNKVVSPDVNKEKATNLSCKGFPSERPPNMFEDILPAKEVDTEDRNKERMTNKPFKGSSSRHPPIMFGSGINLQDPAEPRNTNPEESGQHLEKLMLYRDYLPAKVSTWRGGFQLHDPVEGYEFHDGFQAQPPCIVHRKASEFSRKMPTVLEVILLPRQHIWVDLFQNDCPNLDDIALYFFPAHDTKRAKQNISDLFELMDTKNSVMVSYIDGVELLIFTSEQLHVNSKGVCMRLKKTERFLWGVFNHVKNGKSSVQMEGRPAEMAVLTDSSRREAGGS
ncbi:uncharacterized protein LOC120017005 [Tripterygium wilfordii]|uniref:uncharacterized protein LOC120017005 n=1 Tax=Tripterygium wilfordii TaxID=458696 RepID=UPI0018F85C77|nr:uncharacterized protein LOC120017005 [Tripterygium wilfordii]